MDEFKKMLITDDTKDMCKQSNGELQNENQHLVENHFINRNKSSELAFSNGKSNTIKETSKFKNQIENEELPSYSNLDLVTNEKEPEHEALKIGKLTLKNDEKDPVHLESKSDKKEQEKPMTVEINSSLFDNVSLKTAHATTSVIQSVKSNTTDAAPIKSTVSEAATVESHVTPAAPVKPSVIVKSPVIQAAQVKPSVIFTQPSPRVEPVQSSPIVEPVQPSTSTKTVEIKAAEQPRVEIHESKLESFSKDDVKYHKWPQRKQIRVRLLSQVHQKNFSIVEDNPLYDQQCLVIIKDIADYIKTNNETSYAPK